MSPPKLSNTSKETPSKRIVKTKSAPKLLRALALVVIGFGFISFGISGLLDNRLKIKASNQILTAEVSDDEMEREVGLSKHEKLGSNQAMLFIFNSEDYYTFWMKDMKFTIDILWLNKDKKIIDIKEYVSPATFPNTFKPQKPALYVLELRAGRASELNLKIGSSLYW